MTSYPTSRLSTLSDSHRRMLYEESGIDSGVAAESGVRTITHGRQLPKVFSRRQRRLGSGLLFTVPRPNGESSYSFRPDEPDKPGRKYEQPSKRYGGPGNVLYVHPSQRHLIGDTSVPVIYVEGIKKALSIISAARRAGVRVLVVAISGVWNFLSDGEPIPDLEEIPVEGREVGIAFDSDVLTNPGVQGAAMRLAETEIERGAAVQIAYLPDSADGSKVGADDFLASGKSYAELRMTMRPYDPGDFEVLRLSRNDQLRASCRYLLQRWREGDWMHFVGKADKGNWARGHTTRDTMEALIELALRNGKVDDRGVVIRVGLRRLSEMAAKSAPSVGNAIKHLEADGQLEILPPEDKSKPRSYRLLVPRAALYSMKGGNSEETGLEDVDRRCKGLRAPIAPRLRWSSPGRKAQRLRGVTPGTRRVRQTRRFHESLTAADLEDTPAVKRLGPGRGAIIDTLEFAGGELQLEDLCEVLHRKRPRDVRRRILAPLEVAGIVECEGDVIRLVGAWLDRLEEERERKGEISQAEEQREKHRKDGERYRDYLKSVKHLPSRASEEVVALGYESRAAGLAAIAERAAAAAKSEEQRRAEAFVRNTLKNEKLLVSGGIRLGHLRDIWRDAGGDPWTIPQAVEALGCPVEALPEFGNRKFVFPPREAVA